MKTRILIFLGVLLLGAIPLLAAVDAFMKIDGIAGESKNPAHTNWIEIDSFGFGATQAGSMAHGSGGGAGKVAFHDISITKKMDKASPMLMSAAASGKHFPEVTFDVHGVHYELEDVTITSVQTTRMGDGARQVLKMQYARDAIHDPPVNPNPIAGIAAVNPRVAAPIQQPNATLNSGAVMLQSLRLAGQAQAIIVVCDVNGGQSVAALQRASQSRQAMPTLTVRANPTQQGQQYMTFPFTNVLISGNSPAPGGCSQLTLNFSKFDGPPSGY